MTNVHYLRNQLTFAMDAIRRGLDALEDEPDNSGPDPSIGRDPPTREDLRAALAADGAVELPQEPPDPLARSMALAMTIQRLAELADSLAATHARTIRLEKIVLAIDPEACARNDLFPF